MIKVSLIGKVGSLDARDAPTCLISQDCRVLRASFNTASKSPILGAEVKASGYLSFTQDNLPVLTVEEWATI